MNFLSKITIYYLIIFFLISLCVLGAFQFGFLAVLKQVIPVLAVTILVDTIFRYFKLKNFRVSPSAIITGLIIGLVGEFGENPLILSLIAVLAIVIKVLIKLKGRHIFNPAAAGLLVGILFLNSHPSWWVGGDNLWVFLIWIPILLYKLKRWAPIAGFLVPVVITGGFNILTSSSSLFFLTVMLIEPKTSPAAPKLGLLYGVIAFICYLLISRFFSIDPFISTLLISNLTARVLGEYI